MKTTPSPNPGPLIKEFEDRLSKFAAASLFGECSRVEIGTELLPNSLRADTLLIPNTPLPPIPGAGLLTSLTQDARCLIEPFSGKILTVRLEGNVSKLRLSLHRFHQDKLGVPHPKGVLWVVVTYWPESAISEAMAHPGELLEPGLRKWNYGARETVYMVNSSEIEPREETLFFRLLGKEEPRKQAVFEVFNGHIEPYVTILNDFDMRFKQMAQTNQFQQLDDDARKDLLELRDTREEVLRELGKKEGRQEVLHEIAQKMLNKGEPIEKIASFTGLSIHEINELKSQ